MLLQISARAKIENIDVMKYVSALAKTGLTGIARARKMWADREVLPISGRGWGHHKISHNGH